MFELITLVIGLIASVLFSECWTHDKRPHIIRLCISAVSGAAVFIAVSIFWHSGAFMSAIICGEAVCFALDFIHRERKPVLPKLCLYLSCNTVWLPLCLCDSDVWEYAFYLSALLFCVSMTAASRNGKNNPVQRLMDFYSIRQRQYIIISCLPCIVIIPNIVISAIVKDQTALSALVLSTIFCIYFAVAICLQHEAACRLNAEYLNSAMMRWQSESRDYMNTIRSQRHDFNLHLHAVSGLVSSGKYDECKEYVQKLVSEANDVNDIMPVSDPVVGSMLYNMREKARKQGTDILYHITYDMEDVLCNGFECNKIIGNLLQNAIDALKTDEDKKYGIRLYILKRRGNTVIISENRFTGDPDCIARVFEPGYSTKKGHDGIGLSMILRTVRYYGGRVYPEFEKDMIRFVVNIPNKVDLQKGE